MGDIWSVLHFSDLRFHFNLKFFGCAIFFFISVSQGTQEEPSLKSFTDEWSRLLDISYWLYAADRTDLIDHKITTVL